MIIGKIGDLAIATCDVAPIIGSSDKYLTCSNIYAYYQGQSYSLTKNIYQSGLWASGNSGYCNIYVVYVFTSYPTNFTNNIAGSVKSYDDATNGMYVRLIETGNRINGEIDTPGVIQIGGSPLDFFDSISVPLVIPSLSGGAGSGYIGNPLLSNKKMVGYNVPTSSAISTKTESVEDAKNKATSGKPKIGNGYARITLLQEIIPNPPDEWKTEVEALKDFEIGGKKFINSNIPAGFDGDGFTDKGNYTYVCISSSTNWQSSFDFSHIATIRITTNSGGGYDVAYENLDHVHMRFQSHISMYGFGMCQLRTGSIDPYYFWPYNTITWQESYEMATNQTHFDNLTNLFKYLNVHYRNVNLFVDGECWALAAKQ